MEEQSKDDKIIWKAVSGHQHIFGMQFNENKIIYDEFLPLMKKYGYDVYLNGHEHLMDYSYIPTRNDTVRPKKKKDAMPPDKVQRRREYYTPIEKVKNFTWEWAYPCWTRREWFFEEDYPNINRNAESKKGDYIHEITAGACGEIRNPPSLCQ